jgi:3-oxochol-4-en-24-oyl-CoA dehydrogenase
MTNVRNAEDEELRQATTDMARAVLSRHSPIGGVNARQTAVEGAADAIRAVGELGLLGIGVDPELGGSGGSLQLAGLVAEVAGTQLAAGSILHQNLAAHILSRDTADIEMVASVISGSTSTLVAFTGGIEIEPGVLSVPFGFQADQALIVGAGESGAVRRSDADSIRVAPIDKGWMNPICREAHIATDRATDLSHSTMGRPLANLLSAMYMTGAALRLLDDTVAYVKTRTQFGVPIGSFQAVKHLLSNASIGLYHARAMAIRALEADESQDLARIAAVAKSAVGNAAIRSAETCLQAMGGIGYTWEADVHLFLKTISRLRHWPQSSARLEQEVRSQLLPSRSA